MIHGPGASFPYFSRVWFFRHVKEIIPSHNFSLQVLQRRSYSALDESGDFLPPHKTANSLADHIKMYGAFFFNNFLHIRGKHHVVLLTDIAFRLKNFVFLESVIRLFYCFVLKLNQRVCFTKLLGGVY